jgi:hypothetical protein
MEIYNWVVANKLIIGSIAVAILLGWNYVVSTAKSVVTKFTTKSVVSADSADSVKVEVLDQDALRHLRTRASQIKNSKLIAVIKEADSIFYDIHAGVSNEV